MKTTGFPFVFEMVLYYMARFMSGQDHGTKSCNVIGYLSGQDGAILPTWDYPLYPARKISLKAI